MTQPTFDMPYFHDDSRLQMLRRAISAGTIEDTKAALAAIRTAAYSLSSLMQSDPPLLLSFCSRLSRAKTWTEFDDFYECILKEAPEIKTMETAYGSKFADTLMQFALENQSDPNRIRTMLIKLKNDNVDLSSAESSLPDSHAGRAIARMVAETRGEIART